LEDNLYVASLFDAYGELLNERQREIMRMRTVYDYSLSEIGEELNISRQAVHDAEKKSVETLKNFEKVLSIVEKQRKFESVVSDLREKILSINMEENDKKSLLDKLDELEEEIG
jgi:hypothetical protein